jgi:hypothetical protein
MSIIGNDGETLHPHLRGLEWIDSLGQNVLLNLFTSNFIVTKDTYIPRGQDFTKQYPIIFGGCSETHGSYLSDNDNNYSGRDIWGFLLAKYLNKPAVNLGSGGKSAQDIVRVILNYISLESKPEYIFCLFPDLNRLNMPNDPNILIDKFFDRDGDIYNNLSTSIPDPKIIPNYTKKPHLKEDVIPRIVPVWSNLQSILLLEKLSSLAGIKLKYSTWSEQTHSIITGITEFERALGKPSSYPNYVSTDPVTWLTDKQEKCDGNHIVDIDTGHKYFHIGSDALHMGAHRHAHIADELIKNLT